MKRVLLVAAAALALVGCGEKPQELSGVKQDAAPFQGTGMPYVATGWKAGDKASWEQQLRVRTQNTQNEYNRVN